MRLQPQHFLASSGALLGLAHIFEATLPIIRNVVLARMLTPSEFALALALAAVAGMAEMISDFGLPQYVLRAPKEERGFRNTLHSLSLMRACLIGGAVGLAGYPLSLLFRAPGSEWAFALAGLTITIKGFSNLAVKQVARDGRFAPDAVSVIASQVTFTLAVIVLCMIWGDHRAMAGGLLIYSLTFVAVTNLMLPMRFGFAWDKAIVASAVRYGGPLIPNGIALAITGLSDRLIIGGLRGLETLALYGPLASTAMLPRATALRYAYNLFLPPMVKRQEEGRDLTDSTTAWFATISLLAVSFALGFICLGETVITLTFGSFYRPAPILTIAMGALLAVRMVIAFPIPLAMARERTWFVTGSSMITAMALLPATFVLSGASGSSVEVLAAFIGTLVAIEMVGFAAILLRTRRAFPDATQDMIRDAAIVAFLVFGLAGLCLALGLNDWLARLAPCAIGIAIACLIFGPRVLTFFRQYNRHDG